MDMITKCCFCKQSNQTKIFQDTDNMIIIKCPECTEYKCSRSFYEKCEQENFTKNVLDLIASYLASEESESDLIQSSSMEIHNIIEKINSLKPFETQEQQIDHLKKYIQRKLKVGECYESTFPGTFSQICQAKNLGEYNIIIEKIQDDGIIRITGSGGSFEFLK